MPTIAEKIERRRALIERAEDTVRQERKARGGHFRTEGEWEAMDPRESAWRHSRFERVEALRAWINTQNGW